MSPLRTGRSRVVLEAVAVSVAVTLLSLLLLTAHDRLGPKADLLVVIPLIIGLVVLGTLLLLGLSHQRRLSSAHARRELAEAETQRLQMKLELARNRVLADPDLICMCSWCRSVRDPAGEWRTLEEYFELHMHAAFTHGACPECMRVEYPTLFEGQGE